MSSSYVKKGGWLSAALSFILPYVLPLVVIIVAIIGFRRGWFDSIFGNSKPLNLDQVDGYPISTLSTATALQIANRLESYMSSWGTNEHGILTEFNNLTVNDAVIVYNQFGERHYSRIFGEGSVPIVSGRHNLSIWLRTELSESEPAFQAAKIKLSPHNLL